jgi:hypothetical protein
VSTRLSCTQCIASASAGACSFQLNLRQGEQPWLGYDGVLSYLLSFWQWSASLYTAADCKCFHPDWDCSSILYIYYHSTAYEELLKCAWITRLTVASVPVLLFILRVMCYYVHCRMYLDNNSITTDMINKHSWCFCLHRLRQRECVRAHAGCAAILVVLEC